MALPSRSAAACSVAARQMSASPVTNTHLLCRKRSRNHASLEAGQEVRRAEQVGVLIVVAVQEAGDVEGAAHRDARREDVGVPQGHGERVVGAEAAAGDAERSRVRCKCARTARPHRAGCVPSQIPIDALARMAAWRRNSRRPASARRRTAARRPRACPPARRPCRGPRTRRTSPSRSGRPERAAGMAEDQQLHVAAERWECQRW